LKLSIVSSRSHGLLLGAVLGAALAAHLATAPAAKPAPPVSTAVGVSQREFRLTPYRTRVPAGEVRFNVTNFGEDVHDLVVRDARGRVLRRSAEVKAGGRTVVRVKLRRGAYRLSCDVANHAQLGMRAAFTVVR
jgi:plastocyanin